MRRTPLALVLVFCLLTAVPALAQGVLVTVAGGGPNNLPATSVPIGYPSAVASGPDGSYYFVDIGKNKILKVDPAGSLTAFAGSGGLGFDGDGVPATLAALNLPMGLAVDRLGNVFIADTGNNRIRRVDALTGLISTVAGNGITGYSGDDGPATSASLRMGGNPYPVGIAVDADGNLFIADVHNDRVRRVDAATGVITTYAGPCLNTGEDVPAAGGCVGQPRGLAVDRQGSLLITTLAYPKRVRRVDRVTGLIRTIAGGGNQIGSALPATQAYLQDVYSVTVDGDGNIFIADTDEDPFFGTAFPPIRKLDAVTGILRYYSGNGYLGFGGDGGPALGASFRLGTIVSVDSHGDLLIADPENDRIRKIDRVTTIINSVAGSPWPASYGPPATQVQLSTPVATAYDSQGNLFIANTAGHSVLRVDAITDVVTTAAGNGSYSSTGDGLPATQAGIAEPYGIALDANDNLFISDASGHRIRRVDAATGIISTVAGSGVQGYLGDGGPATSARLSTPIGIALSQTGDLYIAEIENNVIRRVDHATGYINTVAGNGIPGFTGDNLPATQTSLNFPWGVALDAAGNLYIGDRSNNRVRRVDALSGLMTTVAGTGTAGFSGDGGSATQAMLRTPRGILVDPSGGIIVADSANNRVRRVDAVTQNIETVAGTTAGASPDGTVAINARLRNPNYITMTPTGELLITDSGNNRIRKLTLTPPSVGSVPDGTSPYEPGLALTLESTGDLRLAWGAACGIAGGDYEVYAGDLGDYASLAPALCSTAGARSVTLPMSSGDRFFLVVPRHDLLEGGYGSASDGSARPASQASCLPQSPPGACGT